MTIKFSQGDLLPNIVVNLRTRTDTEDCRSERVAKDLTGLTARARFIHLPASASETEDKSLFYRTMTLLETNLLTMSSATGAEDFNPTAQPDGPQKLQVEIDNFDTGGTITITGTDVDGEALEETLTVTADGILTTTGQFATIDEDGIAVNAGTFDLRVYVHDGRVQLDWTSGDLDVAGRYQLILELVHSGSRIQTIDEMIDIIVEQKMLSPIPTITSIVPDEGDPTDAVVVNGTGLLDVSSVVLRLEGVDEDVTFTLYSEALLNADIPTIDGGIYEMHVINPGGESAGVEFKVKPYLETVVGDADPIVAGTELELTGSDFTTATAANLISYDESLTVALDTFAVVDSDTITGDVPVAAVAGLYYVQVVLPGGNSNRYGPITIE